MANFSDFLAVWGAIAGTIAILWDIYKWRVSGVRLKISPSKIRLRSGFEDGVNFIMGKDNFYLKTEITLEIANQGDKATTITALSLTNPKKLNINSDIRIDSRLELLPLTMKLPFKLDPGSVWSADLRNNQEAESFSRILIYFSHRKKPIVVRVQPNYPKQLKRSIK